MKKINVLLYGLGKVGMLYDLNKSNMVFTHLKALDILENFFKYQIQVFVYDIVPQRKMEAKEIKSNAIVIDNFENISKHFFDLTIIAVPIESLSEQIMQIYNTKISKKIIVEKPGCSDIESLKKITEIQNIDDILRIGFQRRTLPINKYIKNLFDSENDTRAKYIFNIEFGGTFLNTASHFFDLIDFWIPDLKMKKSQGNIFEGSVIFEKKNFLVTINYKQTATSNIEKNSIECIGSINFLYSESGREIKFFDSNSSFLNLNLTSEFNNMLTFEALDYLSWALDLRKSSLTSFNSSMLRQVIMIGSGK